MDRMGLGYEALAAEQPRLVYASITGYGQTGPWADRRAYAPVVGAESGLTWLQGEARGGAYANDPISHGDVYPALECLAGILAALVPAGADRPRPARRGLDGRDAPVRSTSTCTGSWRTPRPTTSWPASSPATTRSSRSADGQRVVVSGHPGRAGHVRALRPAPSAAPTSSTTRASATSRPARSTSTSCSTSSRSAPPTFPIAGRLEAALAEQGLAMGVLRTVREIADSDWARERGAIVEVPDRGGGTRAHPQLAVALQRRRRPGSGASPRTAASTTARCCAELLRARRRRARPAGGRRRPLQPAAAALTAMACHFPVDPMKAVSGTPAAPTTDGGPTRSSGTATAPSRSSTAAGCGCRAPRARRQRQATPSWPAWRGRSTRRRPSSTARSSSSTDEGVPRFELLQRHGARPPTSCSTCCRSTAGHRSSLPYEERRARCSKCFEPGPGWIVPAPPDRRRRGPAGRHGRAGPRGDHGQAPRQPLRARQALAELAQGQEPPAAGGRDRRLHARRRATGAGRSARCWSASTRADGCASGAASAPGSTSVLWSG